MADITQKANSEWQPITRRFPGEVTALITVDTGETNVALGDIVVSGLPPDPDIVKARLMFKYNKTTDTSGADNYLADDQYAQIKEKTAGAYTNGCLLPQNCLYTTADSDTPGDVIIGDIDITGQVTGNGTYSVQWEKADAHGDNLLVRAVQPILLITYRRL